MTTLHPSSPPPPAPLAGHRGATGEACGSCGHPLAAHGRCGYGSCSHGRGSDLAKAVAAVRVAVVHGLDAPARKALVDAAVAVPECDCKRFRRTGVSL